jgi:hypothetical protein
VTTAENVAAAGQATEVIEKEVKKGIASHEEKEAKTNK